MEKTEATAIRPNMATAQMSISTCSAKRGRGGSMALNSSMRIWPPECVTCAAPSSVSAIRK